MKPPARPRIKSEGKDEKKMARGYGPAMSCERPEIRKAGKEKTLLLALAYLLSLLWPVAVAGGFAGQATAEGMQFVICTPDGIRRLPSDPFADDDPADQADHAQAHFCCLLSSCGKPLGPPGKTASVDLAAPRAMLVRLPARGAMSSGVADAAFFDARGPPVSES
ncbi:hypothetical protein [Marinimicrococcus flavescens]|uniref:DUF2946 domain-containing protein n=1 Tax=Marinimicrococcus flavescens TaxID=3031815 RepID=A0AAP3XS51_9PROT|nr:hypothetical protein [Marinimicrococcus flavescens]